MRSHKQLAIVHGRKKERTALYTTECLVGFHSLLLQSAAARFLAVHAFTRFCLSHWNKMSASVCTLQRNKALVSRHIYQSIGYTLDNDFTLNGRAPQCKQTVT